MKMETVPAPDKEECRVFMYGPVLLANVLAKDRDPLDSDPVIVADRSTDYMQLMDRADLSRLEFVSDRLSDNCRLNLRPLFSVNDEDYALYMNFFTPAKWKAEKVKYEERKKRERKSEAGWWMKSDSKCSRKETTALSAKRRTPEC